MVNIREIHVLVVDDDEDDYLLIKTVLGRIAGARYVVSRGCGFDDGLALLERAEHDVCLLDYRLGARDGLELLDEALRRGVPGPFVMLTGQDSHELDLEAMRRGAADYLSKSRIDAAVLERSIRYAIERERAAAELRRAHDLLEARVEERTTELHAARQEAERLYREAQAANRLKDEFLATVSHELRTPLHVILGYADLLGTRDTLDPQTTEIFEIIRRNARAQVRLVDDLLDVSRIVTGKLDLASRPVQLDILVRSAVDSLRLAAERCRIELDVAADTAQVLGDASRLQQVVSNLLGNALKFTPEGGRIGVVLRRVDKDRVELCVEDTGHGIEPEFLPYVFDRFRQADSRITRKHGGLGLGLAIARHLVEAQGGKITAASAGAGKGATFTVTLPLASPMDLTNVSFAPGQPDPADLAANHTRLLSRDALLGVRVLVVDDAPDVILLLKGLLKHWGAEVTTSSSAEEARRHIARSRPDVLISDIGMPEEDGYQFMRQLRAQERAEGLSPVPSVAMTAYAREEEKTQALAAGFEVHVPKPVDAAMLIRTVLALAERRRPASKGFE